MSDSVKNPPNSSIFDDGLSFLTKDYYAPGAKNSREKLIDWECQVDPISELF